MGLKDIKWASLASDLRENSPRYHEYFYLYEHFQGPSLHFHVRSLECSGAEKTEMVYATLVSWGMHRMGGGATMNSFEVFKASMESEEATKEIRRIQKSQQTIVSNRMASELRNLFEMTKPMKSSVKVVGNSKVLAHYLPSLVCPIDREYTLQFLNGLGGKSIQKGTDFELFALFHDNLVFELIGDGEFQKVANNWIGDPEFCWDTSVPKVIDNLIIGKVLKMKGKV